MIANLAQRVVQALMAREGTSASWSLKLEDAQPGYARVSMVVRDDMLNGHRTAHGGMIFALADSAFAYACNSRNEASVAAQASMIFLAPAHSGDLLIAEARECAVAGRSGAYIVDVRTSDGRPIAHFQGLARSNGGAVIAITEGPSDD